MAEPAAKPTMENQALTSAQVTLLRRIAQTPEGLDFTLIIGAEDAELIDDLAELELHGVIGTTERSAPWRNSRQLTAIVTDLGRALLRTPSSTSPDSPGLLSVARSAPTESA